MLYDQEFDRPPGTDYRLNEGGEGPGIVLGERVVRYNWASLIKVTVPPHDLPPEYTRVRLRYRVPSRAQLQLLLRCVQPPQGTEVELSSEIWASRPGLWTEVELSVARMKGSGQTGRGRAGVPKNLVSIYSFGSREGPAATSELALDRILTYRR